MALHEPHQPDALRLLVCGRAGEDGASRLLAGTGAMEDHPYAHPWRGFRVGGRSLSLAEVGATEDIGAIAALAARCDVLVLFVERDDADVRRLAAVARLMGVRRLVLVSEDRGDGRTPDFPGLDSAMLRSRPGEAELLAALDGLSPETAPRNRPFRMVVDTATGDRLGGTILAGCVRAGDALVAAGSGRGMAVVAVRTSAGERDEAEAGEAVTLQLDRSAAVAPGEVLAAAGDRPETCDQFAAQLLWLGAEPLLPGRPYGLRLGGREVVASVTRIKHRIEATSAAPLAAGTLRRDDLGQVNLSLSEPVAFEPFERHRALGALVLTDRSTGRVVAAGTIDFALRRAANIHRQATDVSKAARAAAKAQRPALLWFTGLSGAGKSTIANLVEQRLFALGHHTYLLDGDNVRHGLNRDLGFTAQDRVENIRRVAETGKLMVDAGLITLASFISPFRAERQLARDLLEAGEFVEVFVDAPLSVAESRDPKGLYAQARAGRIPNFTGIDSPYEAPEAPELHLRTDRSSAEELADEVVAHLRRAGFLAPGRA